MRKLNLKRIGMLLTAIMLVLAFPMSAVPASELPEGGGSAASDECPNGDLGITPTWDDIPIDIKGDHVPTIGEDFKDDRVVVTLKHRHSEINKVWVAADFNVREVEPVKELGIGSFRQSDIAGVADLFRIDDPENNDLVNRDRFHQILSIKLRNPGKENVLAAISAFEELDSVLAAEPDYNLIAIGDGSPDDLLYPSYQKNYNLGKIQYEGAWDAVINSGMAARTVKVGVIEGGISPGGGMNYSHNDLSAHLIPGNYTNQPGDDMWHSTHVAGIIGAVTDNKICIAGVGNGRSGRNNIRMAYLSTDLVASLEFAANTGN